MTPALLQPPVHQPEVHLVIDNLTSGETIHQPLILVTGSIQPATVVSSLSDLGRHYISVSTPAFPSQIFPVSTSGDFKVLTRLQAGTQDVTFTFIVPFTAFPLNDEHNGTLAREEEAVLTQVYTLSYVPLLGVPPLLLAIFVAEDSPLWMDAPPQKASSASHRDLHGAIAKTRLWASLAQSFVAEEMRRNGFGRRSFRLEEEWNADTTAAGDRQPTNRMTAKVHVVKMKESFRSLRDPDQVSRVTDIDRPINRARVPVQQTEEESVRLQRLAQDALKEYGGVFEVFKSDPTEPVVFGVIMDSHYDTQTGSVSCSGPFYGTGGPFDKVHLSLYGSHTLWSWPRFIEEVPSCMIDPTHVTAKSRVSNLENYGATFWEACATSQGLALRALGLALGLTEQSTGVMSKDGYLLWNRSFVSAESYSARLNRSAIGSLTNAPTHHYHLADLLRLHYHPMFGLPSDSPRTSSMVPAPITVVAEATLLKISSPAGLALLDWIRQGRSPLTEDLRGQNMTTIEILMTDTRRRFGAERAKARNRLPRPLSMRVTGLDGRQHSVQDVWGFMTDGMVHIQGMAWVVNKISIGGQREAPAQQPVWRWACLLSKLDRQGHVALAQRLEIRMGAWLDGINVYYSDGTMDVCGCKRHPNGQQKELGGGPRNLVLGIDGVDGVTHIRLNPNRRGWGGAGFQGMTVYTVRQPQGVGDMHGEDLYPDAGQKIVGFFGRHIQDDLFCPPLEFGILTVPEEVTLPLSAYGLPELRNTDGGLSDPTELDNSDLDD